MICRSSFQIRKFEKLDSDEERIKLGKDIYDQFIMKELLSQTHVSTTDFLLSCPICCSRGQSFVAICCSCAESLVAICCSRGESLVAICCCLGESIVEILCYRKQSLPFQ